VYVHYVDTDKRLDEWVPEGSCQPQALPDQQGPPAKKRRGRPPRKQLTPEHSASKNVEIPPPPAPEPVVEENGVSAAHVILSEEEFDMRQHKQLTAQKNFDTVMFDVWKITPW
jgi:histone acetyltransferase MYST1